MRRLAPALLLAWFGCIEAPNSVREQSRDRDPSAHATTDVGRSPAQPETGDASLNDVFVASAPTMGPREASAESRDSSTSGSAQVLTRDTGLADANASDAGSDAGWPWPDDCEQTFKLLAYDPDLPTRPLPVDKNTEPHFQLYFDAPWGAQPVQALAVRPITDNRKILHHWLLYEAGVGGALLTGWAPGKDDAQGALPRDVGLFMPGGPQSLRLELHYYNLGANSVSELDASGLELCIATKAKFRAKTATVFNGFMSLGDGFTLVPANAQNHSVTGHCTVNASEPVHLVSASPHAHRLATHMRFAVQKPGQPEIVMHDAPFTFEEQGSFALKPELILESGDVVTTTCSYKNPSNRDVSYGENTSDEMCYNFATYYPLGALRCGSGLLGPFEGAF